MCYAKAINKSKQIHMIKQTNSNLPALEIEFPRPPVEPLPDLPLPLPDLPLLPEPEAEASQPSSDSQPSSWTSSPEPPLFPDFPEPVPLFPDFPESEPGAVPVKVQSKEEVGEKFEMKKGILLGRAGCVLLDTQHSRTTTTTNNTLTTRFVFV